ncbi:MAG: FprA family A-type flavoprotein [Candidatus Woesearchaeota archaeon]
MEFQEVRPGVFWVGALDGVSEYFDQLMPLPQGTSYNSYLVRGSEKVALVDSVEPRFKDRLFAHLDSLGIEKVDYIVSNHAEQDHSGSFLDLLERYPDAVVVTNEKCRRILQRELHLPDGKFKIVQDKEELSLGDKTLRFLFAPWVHWPETMFTYAVEDGVLFTCDLFGAHLSFDSLWASHEVEVPAKRYFAEIMMPFAKIVKKHVAMVRELRPGVIAPSHGPVHGEPSFILDLHDAWTSDEKRPRVVVAYVSMHGSTKRLAEHLVWKLKEQGVDASLYDIMACDVGDVAVDLVDAATFVLASPAYLGGLHPAAANLVFLLNGFKPTFRYAGFVSSRGWEREAGFEWFKTGLHKVRPEFLEPVFYEGYPDDEGLRLVDGLVEEVKGKHSSL